MHADGEGAVVAEGAGGRDRLQPLKRALQTAQFVGTELGYEAKVEISPALGLSGDYAASRTCWANIPSAKGFWSSVTTQTCFSS